MSNPYQPNIDPYPPKRSSSGNTVLVVLGVIGGIILLVVAICGFSAYMFVSNVKKQVTEFGDAIKEEIENEREDRADRYAEEYATNEKVLEKIGTMTSHELQKTKSTFTTGPMRIDVSGDKGKGVLIIAQPRMEGNRMVSRAFIEVDGEKILIDDNVDSYGVDTPEGPGDKPETAPDASIDGQKEVKPVADDPFETAHPGGKEK